MTRIMAFAFAAFVSVTAWGNLSFEGKGDEKLFVFEVKSSYSWEGVSGHDSTCMAIVNGDPYFVKGKGSCLERVDSKKHKLVRADASKPIVEKHAIDRYWKNQKDEAGNQLAEKDTDGNFFSYTNKIAERVYINTDANGKVKVNSDGTLSFREENFDRPKTDIRGEHDGHLQMTTTTWDGQLNYAKVEVKPAAAPSTDTVASAPAPASMPEPQREDYDQNTQVETSGPNCDDMSCDNLKNPVCQDQYLQAYCITQKETGCTAETCLKEYNWLKSKLAPYDKEIKDASDARHKALYEGADKDPSPYAKYEQAREEWAAAKTAADEEYNKAVAKANEEKRNTLRGQLSSENARCVQSSGKGGLNFKAVAEVGRKMAGCGDNNVYSQKHVRKSGASRRTSSVDDGESDSQQK